MRIWRVLTTGAILYDIAKCFYINEKMILSKKTCHHLRKPSTYWRKKLCKQMFSQSHLYQLIFLQHPVGP